MSEQICNDTSTSGGSVVRGKCKSASKLVHQGGKLMFQSTFKRFKDCKQTTVRNILKFQDEIKGLVRKNYLLASLAKDPRLFLY